MKKKIFSGISVLAIAAVAAANVNLGMTKSSDLSLLGLANVEALASNESSSTPVETCYYTVNKRSGSGKWFIECPSGTTENLLKECPSNPDKVEGYTVGGTNKCTKKS